MTASPNPQSVAGPAVPTWPSPLLLVPPLPEPSPLRFTGRSDPTRDFDPTTPYTLGRDLAYAAALVDAAGRMLNQSGPPHLLSAVAAEALTLIAADGVVVTRYAGLRRVVADVAVASRTSDQLLADAVQSAGDDPCLLVPGFIPDLLLDPHWAGRPGPLAAAGWRSVMTVALEGWDCQDQIRLSWFSCSPGTFTSEDPVAELFGRTANLALRAAEGSHSGSRSRSTGPRD